MTDEKDFFEPLQKYGFTDKLGHKLENCTELRDIERAIRADHTKRVMSPAPGVRLGDHIQAHGRVLSVELWYPNVSDDEFNAVQVGLCHVRATDDILIEYDFDRDGWTIKQATKFRWEPDDEVQDPGWVEVAFVQAWGSEIEENAHQGEKE